jgi:hypothetical protein
MEKKKKSKVPSPLDLLAGKKKEPEEKPKGSKKPRFKRTVIDHHDNGSHTSRHEPRMASDGEKPGDEVSYASADLDGVHDGLEQHLGDPNHDEEVPV